MRTITHVVPPCPVKIIVNQQEETARFLVNTAGFRSSHSVILPLSFVPKMLESVKEEWASEFSDGEVIAEVESTALSVTLKLIGCGLNRQESSIYLDAGEKDAFVKLLANVIEQHKLESMGV